MHTEFNDDLELFPYNRDDGADIDEVLNVRFYFILVVFVDFGFRDFQHCRQPTDPKMSCNRIATAWHTYSPSVPFRRTVLVWLTLLAQHWVLLEEFVPMVSIN